MSLPVSQSVSPSVSRCRHRLTMTSDTSTRVRSLSHRLDREWAQLRRRSEVLERVRSWRLTEAEFATLDEFLTLTGHRTEATADADRLLGRLVGVAADDPLATRIVLQRILPGLLAIVRGEQRRNPRVNAFDLLIGEAWLSIVRYRVDARPTHVAARLLNDARHRAFTNPRRHRVIEEVPCDHETLNEMVVEVVQSPFDELVGALGEARRRGLADDHVKAVGDLITHGTVVRVAAMKSVSTRAVRYQQQHAIKRIRRLVAA